MYAHRMDEQGDSLGRKKLEKNDNLTESSGNVTIIPPTKSLGGYRISLKCRTAVVKIAIYCRVSTGDESQQTSFKNQKRFYMGMVSSHLNWILVDVYADEGITGTSTKHRDGFNRMIQDARDGKIDYIVTKSISRFARNTVTTLETVRELKTLNQPVGVYFEKEGFDSLDLTGELILTILSAFAQEESRSISENIRWSIHKKFEAGLPQINLDRMMGYNKGPNGEWLIDEAQAAIVKDIYAYFLDGMSSSGIARRLNEVGTVTAIGNKWTPSTVLRILRNEKYVGDLEMQKTFTEDFLSHKALKNNGCVKKYFLANHHAPIISRGDWNKVQDILCRRQSFADMEDDRKEGDGRTQGKHPRGARANAFSNLWFNTSDGKERMRRCTYSYKAKGYTGNGGTGLDGKSNVYYGFSAAKWCCKECLPENAIINSVKGCVEEPGERPCESFALYECAMEQSFMEMLYRIKMDILRNGDDSGICRQFYLALEDVTPDAVAKKKMEDHMAELERQIMQEESEIEALKGKQKGDEIMPMTYGGYMDTGYEDICNLIETRKQRVRVLQKDENGIQEKKELPMFLTESFHDFCERVKGLPNENHSGERLNINLSGTAMGTDSAKSARRKKEAYDYLPFDCSIYRSFITGGTVYGDLIEYETVFGVKLRSSGNQRTLEGFLGYRRSHPDGSVEVLDETWKVSGHSVGLRNKYGKKSKKMAQHQEDKIAPGERGGEK